MEEKQEARVLRSVGLSSCYSIKTRGGSGTLTRWGGRQAVEVDLGT